MSWWDYLYILSLVVFAYLTFGMIKSYFKSKFDDRGNRLDCLDDQDSDKT